MLYFTIFSKYGWFQTKRFTGLLEFIKQTKNPKREHYFHAGQCKCMIFGYIVILLHDDSAGAVTALCISGYTGTQAAALPSTVDNNINDLLTYFNNTLEVRSIQFK